MEVARQSGVPEEPLRRYAEERKGQGFGIAALSSPTTTCRGRDDDSEPRPWQVYETPGHAPSHVCPLPADRGCSSPATTCSDACRCSFPWVRVFYG
jgi:glyoxylase-like metal-dependent hydrolase (beta-lactamase superfamily II)